MVNIDDIIEKYAMKPKDFEDALKNVSKAFDIRYICKSEKYAIKYNEVSQKAEYDFGSWKTISDVPLEQRNYYLDSGYWRAE